MVPSNVRAIRKNYFRTHYFILMLFGIAIQPMEKTIANYLYKFYSIAMFAIVYIYFPLAEILYLVYNTDLENITSGTTYICTHTLGKYLYFKKSDQTSASTLHNMTATLNSKTLVTFSDQIQSITFHIFVFLLHIYQFIP